MTLSFKRITSSGNFIPEIDGLRFIAIVSVVLFHLSNFLSQKAKNIYSDEFGFSFLKRVLSNGDLGVPLFFIVSGFILGMPFAKFHLHKGKAINLKDYFSRRLTRLEPPYILCMTVLLFGSVFIAKNLSLIPALKSYFASIFYIHNFVYGKGTLPLLNAVAWSLEIEVQFYILAPLLAYIFCINSALKRRIFLYASATLFLILNHLIAPPFISLFNYVHYFLIGFLLVDLYISPSNFLPKTKFDSLIGLVLFILIWIYNKKQFDSNMNKWIADTIQLNCIFIFYYYILINKIFQFLSLRLITNIGGMCYSIYLLHYPIISMLGNPLVSHSFSKNIYIDISIYTIILLSAILLISSFFFLLIERPCMDKNWYKRIFNPQSYRK